MSEENDNTQEPQPGTPEYDQMMAQKFRESKQGDNPYETSTETNGDETSTETSGDEKSQKPDHVPEKFWDAEKGQVDTEALLKSYQELEKGKSKDKSEESLEESEGSESSEKSTEQKGEETGQEAAEKAGLDYSQLVDKISEKGDIDAEDYEAFEKAGVPKDMVEAHITMMQELRETRVATMTDYIGGQEETNALLEWAQENLSEQEKQTYNDMLASKDWQKAVDRLKTMRGKPDSKESKEPSLRVPNSGQQESGAVGYQTKDEMKADMADPRYRANTSEGEVFRQKVAQKMRFATWRK